MSQQIIPVVVSIVVIIVVAVVRTYSKTLAAITATMPVTVPLSLWIVYAAEKGDKATVVSFSESLFIGMLGTAACVVAMWFAARAGLRLAPTILAGYLAWGIACGLFFGARYLLTH